MGRPHKADKGEEDQAGWLVQSAEILQRLQRNGKYHIFHIFQLILVGIYQGFDLFFGLL